MTSLSSAGRDLIQEAILQDASSLGIVLNDVALQHIQTYLEQLARWNRTYNLTAIRDPDMMRTHHVMDSLAALPFMNAVARSRWPEQSELGVLDVGSGGGLPGVLLAIVNSHWQVCCVDAVEKKVAFIRQMAGVLGLSNLSARHARVEAMTESSFNLVISRAFASLHDFVRLSGNRVGVGGSLIAMKGRYPEEELRELQESDLPWQLVQWQSVEVPGLAAERCLLEFRRLANTVA